MNIYQRSNGRFIVDYLENGTKHQKSFSDRDKAEAFLEQRQKAEEDTGFTLNKCVSAFIEAHPDMADRRVKEYELLVKNNGIAESIRNKIVDSLREEDLNSIRVIGKQTGLSSQTINYKTALLKTIFKWAKQNNLTNIFPWEYIKRLKSEGGSYNAPPEDFLRIYDELPEWAQWACRTCIALCLRPGDGELFSLNWTDFDWDAGTVNVYMSKVKRRKLVYPPKGYLAEAYERFKKSNVEYVIPSAKGGRGYAVFFDIVWKRTREKLGIDESVKPYCMRHIAATCGVINGATTSIMGAQLGHSHPMFTQMTYVHTTAKKEELDKSRETSVFNNFFKQETVENLK